MQTFQQAFAQIQPQLQSLEAVRKKQRSTSMILTFSWLGLVIFGIFLMALTESPEVIITLVILIIAYGIIALIFGQKAIRKYKRIFKDVVIGPLIKAIDPGLQYAKESFVSRAKYDESKIFLTGVDRYSGEDYVWGMVDKTAMEFSELHTQYVTRDSKGRTQYHTIFKGLFMIADFHKEFKCRVVVMPDFSEKLFGGLAKFFQKMNLMRDQLIYMEDPVFEKMFKVYSNDQVEARYILSVNMLKRIVELKTRLNKNISISFINSKMFLAISQTKNLFDPSMGKSVLNPEMIQEFYNQVLGCVQIVDDMNLNTRIWSKT
ncbi:MAG: DUF3137 domain-containing protein [Bacteroidota bacterium]